MSAPTTSPLYRMWLEKAAEDVRVVRILLGIPTDCTMLTPYGVAPRYPGLVPDPTAQETIDAVAAMERIRTAVLALLPT